MDTETREARRKLVENGGSLWYVVSVYPTQIQDQQINVAVIGVDARRVVTRTVSETAWERIIAFTGERFRDLPAHVARYISEDCMDIERLDFEDNRGLRPYQSIGVHRQGSSLRNTDHCIDSFFHQFCSLAEG